MTTAREGGSLTRSGRARAPALLLLALVGCGGTAVLVPPRAPNAEAGLVYFIRQSYPPFLFACDIVLNGRVVASIGDSDFVAVDIPAGRNRVSIAGSKCAPFSFGLEVDPNESHYLVFSGAALYGGAVNGNHVINFEREVHAVPPAEGRRVVRDLQHPPQSTVGAMGHVEHAKVTKDPKDAGDAGAAAIHVRLFEATP